MAIYRFSSGSLIDEVRLVKNAFGGHYAYLHASPNATPAQLARAQTILASYGLKCVPCVNEGKHLLEVRGFKKPNSFLSTLNASGLTIGHVTSVTTQPDDTVTMKERLRNMTLKLTGIIYNIGDVAFLTYTVMSLNDAKRELKEVEKTAHLFEKSAYEKTIAGKKEAVKGAKYEIVGGVGYGLGGIVLSVFGSKDQSKHQIKGALKKVDEYMQKEGIVPPSGPSAQDITRKEKMGPWKSFTNLISRFPSETLNVIYTGVGIFLATGAVKKVQALSMEKKAITDPALRKKASEKLFNEVKDTGLGFVTMSSALAGLLIKEKKPIEGQPKRHGLAGVWDWIQEKPLRATGYGFMVSTLIHAWATVGKYKSGDPFIRKTVIGRGIFVAANIFAEIALAASSKGHGQGVKGDSSVEHTVIASVAETISKQDPSKQEALIERLSGYMASNQVLGLKAEEIATELRTQLTGMKHNPWVMRDTSLALPQEETHHHHEHPSSKVEAASISAESIPTGKWQQHAAQVSAVPHSNAIH